MKFATASLLEAIPAHYYVIICKLINNIMYIFRFCINIPLKVSLSEINPWGQIGF